MSHPRFSSLGNGQGYERKRTNLTINADPPHAASSSASAFSRHPQNFSLPAGLSMGGYGQSQRSASPPASAYFPMLSADPNASLRPTADADAHFGYSTTFRRHQVENSLASPRHIATGAQSLWSKVLTTVTGQPSEEDRLENGRETPAPRRTESSHTASEKFAHASVEVRLVHLCFCYLVLTLSQDTINHFRTSSTTGLLLSDISHLLTEYGYNEFSVSAPEPVLIKFAKTIYESPLILLLCGSATVSAIMGNIDDAVSITVAVLIVLTGELLPCVLTGR